MKNKILLVLYNHYVLENICMSEGYLAKAKILIKLRHADLTEQFGVVVQDKTSESGYSLYIGNELEDINDPSSDVILCYEEILDSDYIVEMYKKL